MVRIKHTPTANPNYPAVKFHIRFKGRTKMVLPWPPFSESRGPEEFRVNFFSQKKWVLSNGWILKGSYHGKWHPPQSSLCLLPVGFINRWCCSLSKFEARKDASDWNIWFLLCVESARVHFKKSIMSSSVDMTIFGLTIRLSISTLDWHWSLKSSLNLVV